MVMEMSGKARAAVVLGFALHVLLLWLYALSGLLVPPGAVLLLLVIWTGFLVLAIRWRRRAGRVLLVPFIALLTWLAIVQGGSWIFGWTA